MRFNEEAAIDLTHYARSLPTQPSDQYRATKMMARTMNAATIESARSSAFDPDVAGSGGGMI
jgi:hypothetical protein